MKIKQIILALFAFVMLNAEFATLFAQSTTFTYQGKLSTNGIALNGNYDFEFSLSNAPSGGSQIGSTITQTAIGVSNGLFTTTLNFGAVFTGNATWLAISVRSNNVGSYTALTPLQELTPAPYAIYTANAGTATTADSVAATNISGVLLNSVLPGFQSASNYDTINGGQGSVNTGGHGTIGGGLDNYINGNGLYATVGGGDTNLATAYAATVAGGQQNNAAGENSFVGGGVLNQVFANGGAIAGGGFNGANIGNGISASATAAFIGGGVGNTNAGPYSTTGGGYYNTNTGTNATIPGGLANLASGANSFAAGFYAQATNHGAFVWSDDSSAARFFSTNNNTFNVRALGGVLLATAGAGLTVDGAPVITTTSGGLPGLVIQQNSANAPNLIGGSSFNYVTPGQYGETISGGGGSNFLGAPISNSVTASWGTVGGGGHNISSGTFATVGGGYNNVASNNYSTVPGGADNIAGGQYSLAAGQQAQALNIGAFVWADSQASPFASTKNDSFNVRAQGGVALATSGAGLTVDGGPVPTLQTNSAGAPNFINGSIVNFASSGVVGATICGGGATNYFVTRYTNSVTGSFGTVGGGLGNSAAQNATVGGGYHNTAALIGTVSGGEFNSAGMEAVVPGGFENVASGLYSFAAGQQAQATQQGSFVWADSQNSTYVSPRSDSFNVRAQGGINLATSGAGLTLDDSMQFTVGTGGFDVDTVEASDALALSSPHVIMETSDLNLGSTLGSYTVSINVATGNVAATSFNGAFNGNISNNFESVSGGAQATLAATNVVLVAQNTAFIQASNMDVVLGGSYSLSSIGSYSVQAPEIECTGVSFEFGNAPGVPVISMNSFTGNLTVSNTLIASNVSAQYIYGSVNPPSDRNLKQNFRPLDSKVVLDKVSALPVTQWNYKTEPVETRHIGPMAQDFHAAFGLNGGDDKHINIIDEGGVALAAIQGLNQKLDQVNKEKDATIQAQHAEIQRLEAGNEALEKRLADLEKTVSQLAGKGLASRDKKPSLSKINGVARTPFEIADKGLTW